MPKLLKIGIVGCGAIGTSLAKTIAADFSGQACLSGINDTEAEKAYKLASELKNQKLAELNLIGLINKSDLIIEATKASDAFKIAKKCILAGKDVMLMSVGGIIEHYKELSILAAEKDSRIFIPSGAICGIDGLKAASCGKVKKVTLTTKKPPKAFLGIPYVLEKKIRLDNIKQDTIIFEGDAYMATKIFPQNINVAATLSIAGIGAKETTVRIIASPTATRNTHEIEIESDSGRIRACTENVVHPDNPKTSYLAVLSAIATLKRILEPIKIGN
ncbi:MAG: aspartate dehydrogenase [Candidatus Omnitrophica bacterium]|nr:aspartate dehydrogenase [Candidatus Omnitrophota bacterium]